MQTAPDPLLQAITVSAVEATQAGQGWLLVSEEPVLRVVAAAGERPGDLLGMTIPADSGSAGFVVASGQPLALASGSEDTRLTGGMAASIGRPFATVLAVPCATEDTVLGALELVDKEGGPFSLDDVELVTLLAGIAGVAMTGQDRAGSVPTPDQLAAELHELATADPTRYAAMASLLGALLADG